MMTTEYIEFRKEREFGDVINATFAFLRQNLKMLAKSLLFIAGPVALAAGLSSLDFINQMIATEPTTEPDFSIFGWSYFLLIILSFVASVLGVTVVNAYIMLYQEQRTGGFDVTEVWEKAKQHVGSMFQTSLFAFFLLFASYFVITIPLALSFAFGTSGGSVVFIGMMVFLCTIFWMVCFFYFIVVAAMLFPAKMHESRGIFETFSRCRYLIKNNYSSSFGVLFVSVILMSILGLLFSAPGYMLSFFGEFNMLAEESNVGLKYLVTVTSVLSSLASSVLYAIPFSAMTMQYFSLVEKKDKTGLLSRIEDLTEEIDDVP